jgi:hypothetical protein
MASRREYDDLLGPLVFDGPDRFHVLQQRGDEVLLVEATVTAS